MNKINITDIKTFMSTLLKKDDFDDFLLKEATITTFSTFTIDGRIKEAFYSKDEYEILENKDFSTWSSVKEHCFNIIKGKKLPVSFKIVLKTNKKTTEELLEASGAPLNINDIEGLFLNIKYENGILDCISSTSLYTFTTDKSLEIYWDQKISALF